MEKSSHHRDELPFDYDLAFLFEICRNREILHFCHLPSEIDVSHDFEYSGKNNSSLYGQSRHLFQGPFSTSSHTHLHLPISSVHKCIVDLNGFVAEDWYESNVGYQ